MGLFDRGYGEASVCDICESMLFDYISGSCDDFDRQWIENHLRECPFCKDRYDEAVQMLKVLSEDKVPELPENFNTKLHAGLLQAAGEMHLEAKADFGQKIGKFFDPETIKEKIKGFGEGDWQERIKQFMHLSGWKVVAPALVCFTLTVGVFSTGLYNEWLRADDVLKYDYQVQETQKPKSTSKASKAKSSKATANSKLVPKTTGKTTAKPTATAKAKATTTPKTTVAPKSTTAPKATSKATAKATAAPKATAKPTTAPKATATPKATAKPVATTAPTPVPKKVATVPAGSDISGYTDNSAVNRLRESSTLSRARVGTSVASVETSMPIIASAGGSSATTYGFGSMTEAELDEVVIFDPYVYKEGYLIRVDDPEVYLDDYINTLGLDEETKIQWKDERLQKGINPKEITEDSRDDALIIKLTFEEWEQLLTYSTEYGIEEPLLIELNGETEEEYVILLTGYGD